MKIIKKLLITITVFIMAVVIILGGALSINAASSEIQQTFDKIGFGTYKDGIALPDTLNRWYYPAFEGVGFPNLDFEQGLKYWTSERDKPTDKVKLNKDKDGNSFITLTPTTVNDGISTVKFSIDKLKEGDTPGVLYKWRGEQQAFQVMLLQYYDADANGENGKILQVGHDGNRGSASIWKADDRNEDEWNTRLSINLNPVAASSSPVYYQVVIESTGHEKFSYGVDVDDIQIVLYNDETREVRDLDRNVLFDRDSLEVVKYDDYDFGDLPDKVGPSKKELTVIITISASALILISLAVILIVIRKRNNNK